MPPREDYRKHWATLDNVEKSDSVNNTKTHSSTRGSGAAADSRTWTEDTQQTASRLLGAIEATRIATSEENRLADAFLNLVDWSQSMGDDSAATLYGVTLVRQEMIEVRQDQASEILANWPDGEPCPLRHEIVEHKSGAFSWVRENRPEIWSRLVKSGAVQVHRLRPMICMKQERHQ